MSALSAEGVTWPEPAWWGLLPHGLAGAVFRRNEPMAGWTTLKVGGPAEVWAVFDGWDVLAAFLKLKAADETLRAVPLTIVGGGSNLMVRDGGIPGIVVPLGAGFDAVRVDGDRVYAEAGASCGKAARAAREAGLTGLEFFGGIPGNVGGALRMNAGAYGAETYDALETLWALDAGGGLRELAPACVAPRYRATELPEGWVYKAGLWRLAAGDKEGIRQRMREINHARSSSQPLHMPSSGSWFKNPVVDGVKTNAWKIVDAAGCRGMTVGGAQVSGQHANFFVNTGGARAADFEALSLQVEATVREKLGVALEREVRWSGVEIG